MPVDFKAKQIRVNQIINSGSSVNSQLLVYGLGSATDESGGYTSSHFAGAGSDVWMFVSGTQKSVGSAGSYGSVAFKGDVVVSGVLQIGEQAGVIAAPTSGKGVVYANGGKLYFKNSSGIDYDLTASGSGGDTYWQSTTANVIFTTGSANSLFLSSSTGLAVTGSARVTGSLLITGSVKIYTVDEGTLNLSSSFGESSLSHVSDGNLYLTNLTNNGDVILGATNSTGVGKQLINLQAGSTTGNIFLSGSTYVGVGSSDSLYVNARLSSDILPDGDRTRNLGSMSLRFANIYTGDLHLRNDRGDWTVIEEETFLRIVNNKTGKNFKMLMEPLD